MSNRKPSEKNKIPSKKTVKANQVNHGDIISFIYRGERIKAICEKYEPTSKKHGYLHLFIPNDDCGTNHLIHSSDIKSKVTILN